MYMWLRKIGRSATAASVVLPAQMMKDLGWHRGDYLQIDAVSPEAITMRRVDPAKLPDRIIAASMPENTITHE